MFVKNPRPPSPVVDFGESFSFGGAFLPVFARKSSTNIGRLQLSGTLSMHIVVIVSSAGRCIFFLVKDFVFGRSSLTVQRAEQ